MRGNRFAPTMLLMLWSSTAFSFSFPEIGFCPLGGPPGWFNRVTGQHDRRYLPLPRWAYRPAPPMNYGYSPQPPFYRLPRHPVAMPAPQN